MLLWNGWGREGLGAVDMEGGEKLEEKIATSASKGPRRKEAGRRAAEKRSREAEVGGREGENQRERGWDLAL